jgi:hypothetical protein
LDEKVSQVQIPLVVDVCLAMVSPVTYPHQYPRQQLVRDIDAIVQPNLPGRKSESHIGESFLPVKAGFPEQPCES